MAGWRISKRKSAWPILQVTPTGSGHVLLARLLNFDMGIVIVFSLFNNMSGATHCLTLDQSTLQPATKVIQVPLTFFGEGYSFLKGF